MLKQSDVETVYQFIADYITTYGISPSIREIAKGCYLGRSAVGERLAILEANKRIRRYSGKARSIILIRG